MANLLSCDSGHDAMVVYIVASGYKITECPLCVALKNEGHSWRTVQEQAELRTKDAGTIDKLRADFAKAQAWEHCRVVQMDNKQKECEEYLSRAEKAEAALAEAEKHLADHDWAKMAHGTALAEEVQLRLAAETALHEKEEQIKAMREGIAVFFHHWKHGGIARDNQFHQQTYYALSKALAVKPHDQAGPSDYANVFSSPGTAKPSGMVVAWDRERKAVLASGVTIEEVCEKMKDALPRSWVLGWVPDKGTTFLAATNAAREKNPQEPKP